MTPNDIENLKQQAQLARIGTGYVSLHAETILELINSFEDALDDVSESRQVLADLQDENTSYVDDLRDLREEILILEDENKNLRALVEEGVEA